MKTKKIILLSSFLAFATICTAQIKVDSLAGMLFRSSNGSIAIGNNLSAVSSDYVPLQILATGGNGGISLKYVNSAYYEAHRVQIDATSATPLALYRSGVKIFHVDGNGTAYTNGTPLSTSDISLKSNIETIPNSLDKVLQLRGVSFTMNYPKEESKSINSEEAYKRTKERTPELTPEIWGQIQKEKERKQMGVIAQEVEKVIPEVVRTREDGLKAVAYSEMIGLLIEAVKEQQGIIDVLKLEVASLKSSPLRSSTAEDNTTGISPILSACQLAQNVPNPFTKGASVNNFHILLGFMT
ncbi:peptidase S74 [Bacteroidia bacterium]|nr:peptidase S74 [Bacteroidia bacterium]